jgi:hypothetical protein
VTRAWVEAVQAEQWQACAALYPPSVHEKAQTESASLTPEQKARLREKADRVAEALASTEPEFVDVAAVLAERTRRAPSSSRASSTAASTRRCGIRDRETQCL